MSSPLNTPEKLRILTVGDSGVGKSSILNLVCTREELRRPRSTVGCTVHVKMHEPRPFPGKSCIVEFWDVGGSPRFERSRQVFFQVAFDGIILVHDLTNSVSRRNLDKWRREWHDAVYGADPNTAKGSMSKKAFSGSGHMMWGDVASLEPSGSNLELPAQRRQRESRLPPTLTIGNKADLLKDGNGRGSASGGEEVESGGDEITASATLRGRGNDLESLLLRMDAFIDRVLDAREKSNQRPSGASSFAPLASGVGDLRRAGSVQGEPSVMSPRTFQDMNGY